MKITAYDGSLKLLTIRYSSSNPELSTILWHLLQQWKVWLLSTVLIVKSWKELFHTSQKCMVVTYLWNEKHFVGWPYHCKPPSSLPPPLPQKTLDKKRRGFKTNNSHEKNKFEEKNLHFSHRSPLYPTSHWHFPVTWSHNVVPAIEHLQAVTHFLP